MSISTTAGIRGASPVLTVLVMLAGLAGLLIFSNYDALLNLVGRWQYEPEYNFGPMVVALVAYLLWARWSTIAARVGGAAWPGIAILLVGLVMCFLGEAAESFYAQQLGFFIALFGAGIAALGAGTLTTLVPLLVLVLLTIPLPYTLQAIVTVQLQLISSSFGVALVRLLGIPVFLQGNVIDLGVYQLQVAEACSGLRYLFPFICLSFLLAYLYEAPLWKRVIVFLMGIPVPIFLNGVRIASTAVLVDRFGIEMAEGFIHYFEGWVVFLAGMALMLLVMLALEGFKLSNISLASLAPDGGIPMTAQLAKGFGTLASIVVMTAVFAAGTIYIHQAAQAAAVPLERNAFALFPMTVGDWKGRTNTIDEPTLNALKSTDQLSADFVSATGPGANLFVAFYESLSKGAALHSPRVCLPGDGWEIATLEQRPFTELEPGAEGTFNRVVIQKGRTKYLVYYWYQQGGERVASEFTMKLNLLKGRLVASRKDGALVRLTTAIDGDSAAAEAKADSTLQEFAKTMLPELKGYLPVASN
ncbi:MAG: VPLPA-CTERM-specific exosortase XrtD [Hyphomicrobiales bacterium]